MWSAYLFDSMTGLLAEQIDLPSFSWTLSVGDCSLSTTRDKGTGEGDASGLRLPWPAVPGSTAAERHEAIAMWRRGIVLMWGGAPVVAGVIGPKSGTAQDVSIDLLSPLEVLAHRYAVREGTFGTGTTTVTSVTTDSIHWGARACAPSPAAWGGSRAPSRAGRCPSTGRTSARRAATSAPMTASTSRTPT